MTETGRLHTFVEVPEEEELTPAGRGGADVTEQIDARVPEHAVEAQHHLQTGREATFTAVQLLIVSKIHQAACEQQAQRLSCGVWLCEFKQRPLLEMQR